MKLSKHPEILMLQRGSAMIFIMLLFAFLTTGGKDPGGETSFSKDTSRVHDLIKKSREAHLRSESLKNLEFADEAYVLSDSIHYEKGKALALVQRGIAYRELSNHSKSESLLLEALRLFRNSHDRDGEAKTCLVLANSYDRNGDYEKAIEFALKSLAHSESAGDSLNIASAHSTLGVLQFRRGDFDLAQKHYDEAILILQKNKKRISIANIYNSLGALWINRNEHEKALSFFQHAASINLEEKNLVDLWTNYSNLGFSYEKLGQFTPAIENHKKSIAICKSAGNLHGLATSYLNLSSSLFSSGNRTASIYLDSALTIAKQINNHVLLRSVYFALSEVAHANGNDSKAYTYHQLFSAEKDSTFSEEKNERFQRLQAVFEAEKKDKQIELLNKGKELKDSELRRQRTISYTAAGALILIVGFSGALAFAYKQKRKVNTQLVSANELIAEKNKAVEEKNKDITDSITYAKNIQEAILPKDQQFCVFGDHFIFYKPRDIVSGDFYFIHHGVNEVILAAADCTGHGVPGAFMSLIGNELLQKAMEKKITDPASILLELNSGIRSALKPQEKGSLKDGMDIAICVIDLNSSQLRIASAHRPVLIARNSELTEIKPDKVSLGEYESETITLSNTYYHLQKGDWIYLSSDGFPDQFGGKDGKKFKSKNLKDLLSSTSRLNGKQQQEELESSFNHWKGNREQVDDVMIIGVKI